MSSYHDYIQKREVSPFKKISGKIKILHILAFGALFFIGNQIVQQNKDQNWIYFVIIFLAVLYFFSLANEPSKDLIPRNIALKIAEEDLKNEIGHVYPIGSQISPTVYYKDQFIDSGQGPIVTKYNLGFKIKEPNEPWKEVVYQMHPYTGECKGVIEKPLGFTGNDIKDLQLITPTIIPEKIPETDTGKK